MPIGANFITISVNLNITSASDSQKASMVSFAFPLTRLKPAPKITANTTICSTSFRDAASKNEVGTACVSTLANVVLVVANCFPASADAASTTPTPGLAMLTAANPTMSATVVTISK